MFRRGQVKVIVLNEQNRVCIKGNCWHSRPLQLPTSTVVKERNPPENLLRGRIHLALEKRLSHHKYMVIKRKKLTYYKVLRHQEPIRHNNYGIACETLCNVARDKLFRIQLSQV